DAYANNIGRSFDWSGRPRLDVPTLPDPTAVVHHQCANHPISILSRPRQPLQQQRPKPHDFETMLSSGYLDRLGFQYRPATAASTFRLPHTIESLLGGG